MTHTYTTTRRSVLRGTAATLASLSLAGSAGAGAQEPQQQALAVLTEDGTRLCGSPDVYDVREGDRVTATVRDGRVVALSRREQNPTDGGGRLTDGGAHR